MLHQIQTAVRNYLTGIDLTDLEYGEVTSINPLMIKKDQRMELPEQVLILTNNVIKKEIDLRHYHTGTYTTDEALTDKIVLNEGLKVGDKVLLLKVKNGQRYIVLDKLQVGG